MRALGKPGPFQIIEGDDPSPSHSAIESPIEAPRRRYDCVNYETCLALAAALNWDNFTCRGCSGEIDQQLLWRARQALKRDSVASEICDKLPEVGTLKKVDQDDDAQPIDEPIMAAAK